MGAKIVLTGTREGRLRKTNRYYAFEMNLGGSSTAPKGLPLPSFSIQYTIFVSLKAGKKAGLESSLATQKWLIKGDLTLDLPVDDCPGEIGVVAFKISALPVREKDIKKGPQMTLEQNSITDIQMIPIDEISLPDKFQGAMLNPNKTESVRKWIQQHRCLDKPLDVCIENNKYWLMDGYRRYVLAREEGFTKVPVRIM